MDIIVGTDEAGRGPVIGPLIVAIASCNRKDESKLNELAKKDSKKLTQSQREHIIKDLQKICKFKYIELSAEKLNKLMDKKSLNQIEAEAMATLIKPFHEIADIMIDLPDRYAWVFRRRMEEKGLEKFEAEHKADENYPIVAAASICAKLERERRVAEIKQETGVDFGSGYPSDPKTRNTIRDRVKISALRKDIRIKWKTLDNVLQRKLFED